MKSSVEQAKEITINHKRKNFSNEELELVIAWLTGEITGTQVARVVKKPPTAISSWIMPRLREAYMLGLIKTE
jgi:hypothetical protein